LYPAFAKTSEDSTAATVVVPEDGR